MATKREEGSVSKRAKPGPALWFHAAVPESPKAIVGLLHGYNDHGARYGHVMDAWAERRIATVALDLRGHGRAGGERGYCARFSEYLDDVSELVRLIRERSGGAPTFFYGHSFGALVAVTAILEGAGEWRGLMMTNPYIGLAVEVPRIKIAAGKLASRLVPKLGMPSGLRGADLTHDEARARAYDNDPLLFKNARARWFTETQAAQAAVLERASSLRLPILVEFGTGDTIAKQESARALFDTASSTDKTWDSRPGLRHEVLNEPEWRPIADKMADWVIAHV
jgi:alpha-beta hydrolase superfamily lysophospholipase